MYIGLDTPYDQYAFYGTSLVFFGGSFRPLRKAYFLHKSVFANTLGWFVNAVFDRPENLRTFKDHHTIVTLWSFFDKSTLMVRTRLSRLY